MNEPKPIFIVRLPSSYSIETLVEANNVINQKVGEEYYTIVFIDATIDTVKFECFYAKDIEEIAFEELKKKITSECEQIIKG